MIRRFDPTCILLSFLVTNAHAFRTLLRRHPRRRSQDAGAAEKADLATQRWSHPPIQKGWPIVFPLEGDYRSAVLLVTGLARHHSHQGVWACYCAHPPRSGLIRRAAHLPPRAIACNSRIGYLGEGEVRLFLNAKRVDVDTAHKKRRLRTLESTSTRKPSASFYDSSSDHLLVIILGLSTRR